MKTPAIAAVLRVAILCLGLLAFPVAGYTQAAKPGWSVAYTEVLAKAKAEKKMVLMDFTGSDWCSFCVATNRQIFSTPKFKKYAQDNLVLLELDFPHKRRLPAALGQQNEALADRYGVGTYPTMVVLDPDGKTLKIFDGYTGIGAEAFVAILEKLRSRGAAR